MLHSFKTLFCDMFYYCTSSTLVSPPHVSPSHGVLRSNVCHILCFVHVFVLYLDSVFKNRALRRILGPKRDVVIREWSKRQSEELNDLSSTRNFVRVIKSSRMRWAGHVARMGEKRGLYKVLVGKPGGKRPLGRPRNR
jgi:hypothetical protein